MDYGTVLFFVAGFALGGACGYAVSPVIRAFRAWRRNRGLRLVSCPETFEPAAVAIDMWQAARAAFRDSPEVRLCRCSRWPDRQGCDQACLRQLEGDPERSKVSSIVEHWYAGKRCAYCNKPIHADDRIDNWLNHRPAFLDAASQFTSPWNKVPAESLPRRFVESRAVCWSCHEAEAFRREFPDLVVERPAH